MKTFWTVVRILFIVAFALLVFEYLTVSSDYKKLKAAGEVRDKEHAAAVDRIKVLETELTVRDERVAMLESLARQFQDRIGLLKKELSGLQATEPYQPELEREPLVINLRAQVAKLTEMFTLSQNTVATQAETILELKGEVSILKRIVAEWKGEWEKENALRLMAQNMLRSRDKNVTLYKLLALGGWAYAALK